MTVQQISVSALKAYARNAKKHPPEQVTHVANSIQRFGWQQPIVIDGQNNVIIGHCRLLAAKQLGHDTVPCVVADTLTGDEIKALRLSDNRTNQSEWDFDLLNDELGCILDIDMSDFGFDLTFDEEPQEIVEDDFDADEAIGQIDEPVTKPGDIWLLGKHRLMCGDSTVSANVGALMGDTKAQCVFTDPPWNVDYGTDAGHPSWKPRKILNDNMSAEQFGAFLTAAFRCMAEASEPGCMTYVVMSAQEWGNVMTALGGAGYHWSSTIIWAKDSLVLSRKDYHTQYEPIWYGWLGNGGQAKRLYPLKDRKQSDLWQIPRPKVSVEHPNMKPVALVAKALQNSSRAGDVVLDLFGGSGTTLIAAEQTGRACRMMELDPKYCDVIIARWQRLTGEKAIRAGGDYAQGEQELPCAKRGANACRTP